MAPFAPTDLAAFTRQMGVPVVFKGVSTNADGTPVMGLFDRPVEMKFLDSGVEGVESAMPELRLPFNAFAVMPQSGDTVTVNGTAYVVSQPTQEDDGAFFCYALELP